MDNFWPEGQGDGVGVSADRSLCCNTRMLFYIGSHHGCGFATYATHRFLEKNGKMMTSSKNIGDSREYDGGMKVRREVMGDSFVDQSLSSTAGTDSEALQEFITQHVWGAVWTRPGLDARSRSLLTLGMLVALRAPDELAGHVRGALNNGLSRTEITEAVIHAAGYCGAPAALSAMKQVQQVFDSQGF